MLEVGEFISTLTGLLILPERINIMADSNIDLLRIDGADDFINGTQASAFNIEEGFYDQCKVCGWVIETAKFNDHERKLFSLIWQIKHEDKVYTKKGKGWSLPLSNNEKATFRIDLMKWFDKNTWTDVCDILMKGGILVKNGDSATFVMDKFFGKFGRLCLKEKTSQKGTKYTVIDSISPAKKKQEFDFDEVPSFMVKNDSVVAYKLADGVGIRAAEAKTEAPKQSEAPQGQPQPKVTQVDAKDFLAQKPGDDDLPF